MFGENLMFGQTDSIIDLKRRIYLAPNTGREEGDVRVSRVVF